MKDSTAERARETSTCLLELKPAYYWRQEEQISPIRFDFNSTFTHGAVAAVFSLLLGDHHHHHE
jgi:hypothetical protein